MNIFLTKCFIISAIILLGMLSGEMGQENHGLFVDLLGYK